MSRHDNVKQQYDDVHADEVYEDGMARMAVYHRHCQDPVIFKALGDIRGKSLIDVACGEGFYTRRFRARGSDPVVGIDLSPKAIERAEAIELSQPLGIEYRACDATELTSQDRFDVATAIHLLHYLQSGAEIETALAAIHKLLADDGRFVTMIANPEFDLDLHDPADSKSKFAYYFSLAEPGNGGLMRFHPGGFDKEQEVTLDLRRWERGFLDDIARRVGFEPRWHEPFISAEGLEEFGTEYFANYLASPQSKLLELTRVLTPQGV